MSLEPLKHPDYFGVHKLFTLQQLFEARVHLGHREGTMNDYMRPYLFGSRMGHLIFDLEQTNELLLQALNFTAHMAYRDAVILFVINNPQHTHLVEKTALECKEFAQTRFWDPSLLSDAIRSFKVDTRYF